MSKSREKVMKILAIDKYKVFMSDLKPSRVLTIFNNLETLMILNAVTFKFNYSSSLSSIDKSDRQTRMQSNLFQLICQ
jgi:hypothetical protein